MRAQEDRLSRLAGAQQDFPHLHAAQRVQRRSRLIQHQQFRIVHQRLRQSDALQHAPGKFSRIASGHSFQIQLPEHLRRALPQPRIAQAVQRAVKTHQPGRRSMVQGDVFGQKSYAPPRRRVTEAMAQHFTLAAGGEHESQRDVNGRGFARAVRAEKTEDLSPLHPQGKAAQRGDPLAAEEAAVMLGDVVECQGRLRHQKASIALARDFRRAQNNAHASAKTKAFAVAKALAFSKVSS